MPLSIKSQEADRLARELARATGESITDAVAASLGEPLLCTGADFARTDVALAAY